MKTLASLLFIASIISSISAGAVDEPQRANPASCFCSTILKGEVNLADSTCTIKGADDTTYTGKEWDIYRSFGSPKMPKNCQ